MLQVLEQMVAFSSPAPLLPLMMGGECFHSPFYFLVKAHTAMYLVPWLAMGLDRDFVSGLFSIPKSMFSVLFQSPLTPPSLSPH